MYVAVCGDIYIYTDIECLLSVLWYVCDCMCTFLNDVVISSFIMIMEYINGSDVYYHVSSPRQDLQPESKAIADV